MRMLNLMFALVILTGCATNATRDYRLDRVRSYLANGNLIEAFNVAKEELRYGGDRQEDALKEFASESSSPTKMAEAFGLHQTKLESFDAAVAFFDDLNLAGNAGIITSNSADSLKERLRELVFQRTLDRTYLPTFGDQLAPFDNILSDRKAIFILTENTLNHLQRTLPNEGQRRKELSALVDYIKAKRESADISEIVRKALDDITFSVAELREDVSKIDSEFASAEIDKIVVDFFVTGNQDSRLIGIDIADAMQMSDRLTLVEEADDAEAVIKLDELDYRETINERPLRTVTVGYYQADPLYAALFMPKGASFLYDVEEGRVRIDWAYEVAIKFSSNIEEINEILRGSIDKTYHQCLNPRVRNVFGGFNTVYDWPNSQTKSYCSRGSDRIDAQSLKDEMIREVADKIADILNRTSGAAEELEV